MYYVALTPNDMYNQQSEDVLSSPSVAVSVLSVETGLTVLGILLSSYTICIGPLLLPI